MWKNQTTYDDEFRWNAVDLRLRVVARPDKMVAELLAHLGLELPRSPKIVQNVVPQNAC